MGLSRPLQETQSAFPHGKQGMVTAVAAGVSGCLLASARAPNPSSIWGELSLRMRQGEAGSRILS